MKRYINHDTEDIPFIEDSAPLDLVPLDHTISKDDNESSEEYSKETVTQCPLAELLEQLQQLQDQFAC